METISSKDSKYKKNYIAFFDLDGTVISANSGKVLIHSAYKKRYMRRRDLVRGIYLSMLYRFELKETAKIINLMLGWLKGVTESVLINLSDEIFRDHLLKAIRPEVVKAIRFHKKEGALVVILSSAITPVCKAVADHLEIDDIICTALETRNGILTGNPEGPLCFGNEKVIRLMEFCNYNNINPCHSWYYGDSIADLPVLSSVGNPVCINPDKKLLKEARKRNWKIMLCD